MNALGLIFAVALIRVFAQSRARNSSPNSMSTQNFPTLSLLDVILGGFFVDVCDALKPRSLPLRLAVLSS